MGSVGQIIIIGVLVFLILFTMWRDSRKDKRKERKMEKEREKKATPAARKTSINQESADNQLGTRDFFLATLTKIGCQYELGESDENRVFFAYQGEHFVADTSNDSVYVHLWDPCWNHVELYDIDEVSRMRKAINYSNLNASVTTVFTIDDTGKIMEIHSKSVIPFLSSMQHLEDYLQVELTDFFRAHHLVETEMIRLRENEKND